MKHDTSHHHTAFKHNNEHRGKHHGANEHMHKASMEELIERFESPERDAYQKPEAVMAYLGDLSGQTVMDIGAGSGYFSVKLAKAGAKVIAADIDKDFQKYLGERIQKEEISNIELRLTPYDGPGLSEKEVDMALIVNTYHHIEDRVPYFKKVYAGTKSGGSLVVIDFFKAETPVGPPVEHKISIDQVIAELKQSGYSSFDIDATRLPYQYILKAK